MILLQIVEKAANWWKIYAKWRDFVQNLDEIPREFWMYECVEETVYKLYLNGGLLEM